MCRYLLRDFVLQYLTEAYPKWGAIDRALEREGWKLVTLLRLSPIAPWNVLNYALAVTAVPVGSYALASSLAVRCRGGQCLAFWGLTGGLVGRCDKGVARDGWLAGEAWAG